VLDDANAGYGHLAWVLAGSPAYNTANGETRPACGDLDHDGVDEIVVGFGSYPALGGYVRVLDDANAGYGHLAWVLAGWPAYNGSNGETRPACGNLDADAADELIVGFGAGADGYVRTLDDAAGGYAHLDWLQVPWPEYNAAVGGTWPACWHVGRERPVVDSYAASPERGESPLDVTFTCQAHDPDGVVVQYVFDFGDGSGRQTNSNGIATHTYLGPQYSYRSYCIVTDDQGHSATSAPARVTIPGPVVCGLGTYPTHGGRMEVFLPDYNLDEFVQAGWSFYNATDGEVRVVTGDVDGDGKSEYVVGFSTYPASGGWIRVVDDVDAGYMQLAWVRAGWAAYNAANGETWPACGDVDGDGRDEIVVGFGTYTNAGGWIRVLDDAPAGFTHMRWVRPGLPSYNVLNGEIRPSCGDVDGDLRDEIVVGYGNGGNGWVRVLDDAIVGHRHLNWLAVGWTSYNTANGETRPACGDVDGDGRDEILVGYGTYTASGGWVRVLDDAMPGYPHLSWIQAGWAAYNTANGETRPACGDVDRTDPADEIVVGFGVGGDGRLRVLDDAASGHVPLAFPQVHAPAYNAANGETWPAVK